MTDDLQLKVQLVYDGNAASAEDAAKKSSHAVSEHSGKLGKEAGHKMSEGLAGEFLKGEIYLEIAKVVGETLKKAAEAPFEAYRESEEKIRALTGQFMGLNETGMEFEKIAVVAEDVHSELQNVAIAAGTTTDAVQGVFEELIRSGTRSIEKAQELSESMTYAGRAVPGGAQAIADGFHNIELGIIRARNPLIQMIASTHTLNGNAKQVAAQMSKMSIEKQMELAEKAVTKMGAKLKEQPMTIDMMLTSLGQLSNKLLETAGKPMVEAAGRAVAKIRSYFFDESGKAMPFVDKLAAAGVAFGEVVGDVFEVGTAFVESFISGFDSFNEEFKFLWDYIFGGNNASVKDWKDVAKSLGEVFGVGAKLLVTGLVVVADALKLVFDYAIKAFGVVLVGLGEALKAVGADVLGKTVSDMGSTAERFSNQKEREQILQNVRTGATTAEKGAHDISNLLGANQGDEKAMGDALDDRRKIERAIKQADLDASKADASDFAKQYSVLEQYKDKAEQERLVDRIANDKKMADALVIEGANIFGKSSDSFIAALKQTGHADLAKELTDQRKVPVIKGGGSTMNQYIGTVNIKQDFKDTDPDRIAIVFRRDLANAGANRIQARGASPFMPL